MNILPNGKKKWQKEKDPYVYPHLEDFHPMVNYAITISPSQLLRADSLVESVNDIFSSIMPCFRGTEYSIRPEISTKSTILHYHGIIQWNNRMDITNFYWKEIRKLKAMCTFTIKTIDNMEDWHKYCIKQRLHMKEFLLSCNLRYRLTNLHKSPYIKIKRPSTNKINPLDRIMVAGCS